ncbi:MAG: SDR family oxidoreductase [Candidatus Obscuribacterales bacterium]|nr:SDR family oxidoreductase [Candidatus Obscuribacterales bacterium]
MILENSSGALFADDIFKNRNVFLSGASRGIGRAVALAFARYGANLYLVAKDAERLKKFSEELESIYTSRDASRVIRYRACDFSQLEEVEAMLEEAKQAMSFHIVVNNAGIYQTEALAGHSLASWRRLFDINLNAAMLIMSSLLPPMIERKSGRIINISSISGSKAEAWGSAYSAAKFALNGLTQAAALENARFGITINAVCPGWVLTDLAQEQIGSGEWQALNGLPADQSMELTKLSVPQERFLSADEIASTVLFLASDQAQGITGQAINICGGLSL